MKTTDITARKKHSSEKLNVPSYIWWTKLRQETTGKTAAQIEAENPQTSGAQLQTIAQNLQPVRSVSASKTARAIAAHPNCEKGVMEDLYNLYKIEQALADNPNTPRRLIGRMVQDGLNDETHQQWLTGLKRHPNISKKALRALVRHKKATPSDLIVHKDVTRAGRAAWLAVHKNHFDRLLVETQTSEDAAWLEATAGQILTAWAKHDTSAGHTILLENIAWNPHSNLPTLEYLFFSGWTGLTQIIAKRGQLNDRMINHVQNLYQRHLVDPVERQTHWEVMLMIACGKNPLIDETLIRQVLANSQVTFLNQSILTRPTTQKWAVENISLNDLAQHMPDSGNLKNLNWELADTMVSLASTWTGTLAELEDTAKIILNQKT